MQEHDVSLTLHPCYKFPVLIQQAPERGLAGRCDMRSDSMGGELDLKQREVLTVPDSVQHW